MIMITLKNYLIRNLNQEEKGKFIRNVKRFKFFYKQNKDKSAFFMLLRAFDFNNSLNGQTHKYCYFFNEKGDLIEIIEHNFDKCHLVYKK